MTNATLPALPNRDNHFLISPDGSKLLRFCDAGGHQMWMAQFAIKAGAWEQTNGGCDWVGRMRDRYQAMTAKGYRKIS
jgi:hypothetical protein